MSYAKIQLDKAHASTLLNSIFQTFQTVFNGNEDPKPEDFLHILTPNFHFTSNGASCKNLYEYTTRVAKIKRNFKKVELKNPQVLLVADNKVVVNYLLSLIPKQGDNMEIHLMAVATVDHEHFTEWNQVTHQKGSTTWD